MPDDRTAPPQPTLEALTRLTRDILASISPDVDEIRFLVDTYYQLQDFRMATGNQMRSLDRKVDEGPSEHKLLDWLFTNLDMLENQMKRAFDAFSMSSREGIWLRSIYGIGPVIASGLLAHIDIEKAPTAGHIWRFAGLDPTSKWNKGEKRPFNARLKVICWHAGQSFMKNAAAPECFYGKLYRQRKQYEIERNDAGGNAEEAAKRIVLIRDPATKKWLSGRYPTGTTNAAVALPSAKRDAYLKTVECDGGTAMLPLGQIDARARRYAVKILLSHLHHVMYDCHFGKPPPVPYAMTKAEHAHFIPPPGAWR